MRLGRLVSLILKRKETMPITIPPVPETLTGTAENLYGDVHKDLPPLAWSNPDFHSRLAWIKTQIAHEITAWYQPVNAGTPGFPALRISTHYRAEVSPGNGADIDVRRVMQRPDVIVYELMTLVKPDAMPMQLKPYPGYAALNPATDSPIGPAWEPSPWPGRKVYRANAENSYKPGDRFETESAIYEKVLVSTPGQGPFGIGGTVTPAWQLVYSR